MMRSSNQYCTNDFMRTRIQQSYAIKRGQILISCIRIFSICKHFNTATTIRTFFDLVFPRVLTILILDLAVAKENIGGITTRFIEMMIGIILFGRWHKIRDVGNLT